MKHTEGRHANIAVYLPQEGCPFHCVFCDQRKTGGSTQSEELSIDVIKEQIEAQLKTSTHCEREIAFFGGTFTGIVPERRKQLLELASAYVSKGLVCGIRLSTRPDLMDNHIAHELASFGVTHVELGVQSLADEVLHKSCRGYTSAVVAPAIDFIRRAGMSPGIQLMPGLPGETKEHLITTMEHAVALQVDEVRIYPTLVIEGTVLADMYNVGTYTPLTLEQAISACAMLQERFELAGMRVLRVGLAEMAGLSEVVLAGPYHPAFGELVLSRMMRHRIEKKLACLMFAEGDSVWIYVSESRLSQAIGHGKCNKNWLVEHYPGVRFHFEPSHDVDLFVRKE